jgi:hypothetical protein
MKPAILYSDGPVIIQGQVVKRDAPPNLTITGLSQLGQQGLARLQLSDQVIIIRIVKVIIRPSGRSVHLSRYLIGVDTESGTVWEIFLGVVLGLRNALFRLRLTLFRSISRWLTPGLSPLQSLNCLT